MPRPRRSVLYVPAVNDRAVAKLAALACDAVILDLEDSVLPEAKPRAREAAVAGLRLVPPGMERVVRVNAVGSAEGRADLERLARAGANAIVLPKVEAPATLLEAAARLDAAGGPPGLALWAMIETPLGVLEAAAIARCSPRLQALVLGTADLGRALRARPVERAFATARGVLVLAARVAGIDALDAPAFDLADEEALEASCVRGRDEGFDGRTLIHPRQIDAANRAYGPSPEEVAWARAVGEAHAAARAEGRGVAVLGGRLVEALHVEEAARVLALAEAIGR